jgi:hypothetical protein
VDILCVNGPRCMPGGGQAATEKYYSEGIVLVSGLPDHLPFGSELKATLHLCSESGQANNTYHIYTEGHRYILRHWIGSKHRYQRRATHPSTLAKASGLCLRYGSNNHGG